MNIELNERDQWTRLRDLVDQTYIFNEHWEEAIILFNERLRKKYFKPIKLIISLKALEGEGFTMLTIQCALIEMFAAFREGKIFNYENANKDLFYYKDSKQIYQKFLREASIFENIFWKKKRNGSKSIDTPFKTIDFYNNVRCSLLHEARTKDNWYISATKVKPVIKETQFIKTEDEKNKIYRTILHYQLLNYLKEYSNELRDKSDKGKDLRKKFARKLDDLFDFNPDPNSYNWWET